MTFYAVYAGREPGVYKTWDECKYQTSGYPKAIYKKFTTLKDAQHFAEHGEENIKPSLSSINDANSVEIFTDGACKSNGKSNAIAGIGIFFGIDDSRNISEPLPKEWGRATNQLAELFAIYRVTQILIDLKEKRHVKLYTDSMYSINCLTNWHVKWAKDVWIKSDKKPVLHKELIQATLNNLSLLDVEFIHVKGHAGNFGNEQADKLAVAGSMLSN